jgi:hypothetical protein
MDVSNPIDRFENTEFKLVVSRLNPNVFFNSCFSMIIANTNKTDKKVRTKMPSACILKLPAFEDFKFCQRIDYGAYASCSFKNSMSS